MVHVWGRAPRVEVTMRSPSCPRARGRALGRASDPSRASPPGERGLELRGMILAVAILDEAVGPVRLAARRGSRLDRLLGIVRPGVEVDCPVVDLCSSRRSLSKDSWSEAASRCSRQWRRALGSIRWWSGRAPGPTAGPHRWARGSRLVGRPEPPGKKSRRGCNGGSPRGKTHTDIMTDGLCPARPTGKGRLVVAPGEGPRRGVLTHETSP